jgi:peptidoglycan/LPS O-acetylase OafA/YrhL
MTGRSHQNQLDKIRILAALAVILSHHVPLAGATAPTWLANRWVHWSVMGGVGVMIFFCISGYLVTSSWYREPRFIPFMWKRLLRLWPGMLGSVACTVFVFGAIFNELPLSSYLAHPSTWKFFFTNISLIHTYPFLPGAFGSNPVAQVANGVYWTIPMELMCYLVLAILGLIGAMKNRRLLRLGLILYITAFLYIANPDFTGFINHWIEYPAYFAAGALIALNKQWFSAHGKRFVMIVVPICFIVYILTPYTATARLFIIPPLVIFLGTLPAKETWFSRLGDPSYGVYLYGYPIAQTMIALWPDMNFWLSLSITCFLAMTAGYASWKLIESRALRWKDSRPRISIKGRKNFALTNETHKMPK